jgi:hypothetical protein
MRRNIVFATLTVASIFQATTLNAAEPNRSAVYLVPTDKQAKDDPDPVCRRYPTDNPTFTAEDLLKVGAGAIDAYLGGPYVTPIVNALPKNVIDALKNLGGPSGQSVCSTQCVIAEKNRPVRMYFARQRGKGASPAMYGPVGWWGFLPPPDTGPDSYSTRKEQHNFTQYASIKDFTTKPINEKEPDGKQLICATFANWSTGDEEKDGRWAWIQAY